MPGPQIASYSTPTALVDTSGTITWDASQGAYGYVTLTSTGRTLTITNAAPGSILTLRVIQDATGSRTITTYTNVVWASATAPTLTTTAAAYDVLRFTWDAVLGKFVGETVAKALG